MKSLFMSLVALSILGACSSKQKTVDTAEATPEREAAAVAPIPDKPTPPLKTVYFDTDSASIRGDAVDGLKASVQWLNENPNVTVRVEGHTDERGSASYNKDLGKRRAAAVRSWLVKNGIKKSRLEVISFGKDRPADSGTGEAAWANNRRVESVTVGQGLP